MAFCLQKLPCCHVRVLDESQVPPADLEHSPSQFPEYYSPLYFPEFHKDTFASVESVCAWLRDLFSAESGWTDVKVIWMDAGFMVDDVSYDLRVFIPLEEVTRAQFHPRTYYKLSYTSLQSNPSWLYRSKEQLRDAFEGITVKEMSRVVGNSRKVKRRNDAIEEVVSLFLDLAQRYVAMPDSELLQHCEEKGIKGCPEVNGRRWMCFELFRVVFGDKLFPKIVCSMASDHAAVPHRGNSTLRAVSPELDVETFRARARTLSNDVLKRTVLRLHHTKRSCSLADSRAIKVESLRKSLLRRWNELICLPAPAIGDFTNAYTGSVSLNSTFGVLDLLEFEYGTSFCNRLLAPIRERHRRQSRKNVRKASRDQKERCVAEQFKDVEESWPEVVPIETKLKRAREYMQGSKWPKTYVCSVCSRELEGGSPLEVSQYDELSLGKIKQSLHFELLKATEDDKRPDEDIIDHSLLRDYLFDP